MFLHPQEYARNLGPFINVTRDLYRRHEKLLKWKSEPESIMDLGIGDGRMTKEVVLPIITNNIKEYVGADISLPMLQSVRETIAHEKLKTIQLDITVKNIPNELKNRFDHIISNYLFHHVPPIRQALTNIKDMLKPGGQLVFNTFAKGYWEEAYDILDRGKWSKYNNRKSNSPFSASEDPLTGYQILINNLGYVDCHIIEEPYKPLMSKESFEEVIVAGNTRLPDVNEEDREEYIKDYLEAARNGKRAKPVIDEHTGRLFYELTANIISGVITKPL